MRSARGVELILPAYRLRAVLVAGCDEVLGPEQGRALYDGYGGPKRLWVQPAAGHNGLDLGPAFWGEALGFIGTGKAAGAH